MTTIKYLSQIEIFDRILKNKLLEIERLEALLRTIPALPYDQDKVQSSGVKDTTGDKVTDLLDKKHDASVMFDHYLKKQKRIVEQINSISDSRYITVLSLRYLEYKELYQVTNETGYSYSHVKRLHKDALREFEKMYGGEYLNEKLILNELL